MPRRHECSWRRLAESRGRALERAQADLAAASERAATTDAKLTAAQAQIAEYERRLFGRTTERVPPVDAELRRRDAEEHERRARDGAASDTNGQAGDAPKRRKRRRRDDAPGLRRETIEHHVSPHGRKCPFCGGTAEPIGTGKFTTEWEYVPGYFVCRRHIQEVVACKCGKHIARAEAPLRVFDRTQYGPGLIAYLIVSKCADSVPIYRVEKQFERLDIPIARSTLNDLVHRAADILDPLYDALLAHIVQDPHCQADETSCRLHSRPDRRGYIWTFLADKCVAYVFSSDRSGDTPANVLGGTKGTLVVDGYTGYNRVTDVEGRQRGGCWSHARRYLFNALVVAPEAREALDLILDLFMIERKAMNGGFFGTAKHLALRRDRSQPVLERIKAWLTQQAPLHPPESPMGIAIRYCTNQWPHLTLFMSDAKVPIHNNASEAALRVIALGRKNYLFFGNNAAARNFAVLYSLVVTAERH